MGGGGGYTLSYVKTGPFVGIFSGEIMKQIISNLFMTLYLTFKYTKKKILALKICIVDVAIEASCYSVTAEVAKGRGF